MSKGTTTWTTIAALSGWFVCELDQRESGDELAYKPIVAWEIEIEITPRGRLRTVYPISLEIEDDDCDPVLKSPDGQFICPCICSFETAADVVTYLQRQQRRPVVATALRGSSKR